MFCDLYVSVAALGAIYSQADSPPVQSADKFHLGFKDGTAIEYDRAAHVLALNFQDGTAIKYDGGAHALTLNFEDQAAIRYDAAVHAFSMLGAVGTAVTINAPAGITLQSDASYVTILPTGVTVNPPLP